MLNSLALPTQSAEDWERDLDEIKLKKAKLIVSVYGGDASEFAGVTRRMSRFGDAIEVNLGCPNKEPGEQTIMESIGQNPTLSAEVIERVRDETDKPVIAKLSPNSDYLAVADSCMNAGADALGCGNTLGPGLAVDIRSRAAILAGTTGGISGPALKPVNLRMTYEAYARFRCPIVAYGGIETWEDGVEYILAGAGVLGIGTAFMRKSTHEAAALTRGHLGGDSKLSGRGTHVRAHRRRPPPREWGRLPCVASSRSWRTAGKASGRTRFSSIGKSNPRRGSS